MHFLLYRIEESNGFVAKRVICLAGFVAMAAYGHVMTYGRQIITPDKFYQADNFWQRKRDEMQSTKETL